MFKMALSQNKSYVHAPSLKPFIGLTMHEMLEERVKKNPDREMFIFLSDNERVTFAEFKKRVVDLAAGFLLKLGLRRGDRIAVIGANHVEWPLITAAARAIGVGVANLLLGHTPQTFMNIISRVSCKALFITRSPDTLYSMACEMIPELSESIPGDLNSKHFPDLKKVVGAGSNCKSGMLNFDEISISGCEEEVAKVAKKVTIDDISHFNMTSGSTGTPKLAPYTHFTMLNSYTFPPNHFDEEQINKLACIGNMAYVAATQMSQVQPLLYGTTSVFPSPTYTFEKFLQAVEAERCTFFLLMIDGVVDLAYNPICDKYDLSSLKSGVTGGSPIPSDVIFELNKKLGVHLLNVYGCTETLCVSCLTVNDSPDVWNTSGRPFPNVEIQIVDEEGCPVEVGEKGEIFVRSPTAFRGYCGDIEKTKQMITENGWIKMGDVGKLNADGYLTIVGRIKDIIIRRGVNVHPSEVESIVTTHPAVKSAQVLGIPDYRVGEDVCVCVTLNEGYDVTEEELKTFFEGKMSDYIQPTYFLIFASFQSGASGKVNRTKLREMAIGRIELPETPYAE
ncbi:medium-chain acyl-CoA ligase ACSF2, mitochondrial-like isoform X1 [Antedon mediterranea]|uniref:medium-chain acyl-CoA ligase ACSF2, mitochondrial-like isoform X1 n=1 Tax=Antedon mediterranea TaxID=105859 RepID=UPI003AF67650